MTRALTMGERHALLDAWIRDHQSEHKSTVADALADMLTFADDLPAQCSDEVTPDQVRAYVARRMVATRVAG